MKELLDMELDKHFEYENKFYLTAPASRLGKFAAHLELFKKSLQSPGDIVECGVYKGASLSRFLKFREVFAQQKEKRVIGFDTFGEFPEAQHDFDKAKREQFIKDGGSRSISKEALSGLFKGLGLNGNVELVEGNVFQTIPEYKRSRPDLKISLLHIDVDLYEATKFCLEELCGLVSKGGVVILDDYNKFVGATKAIDEYLKGKDMRVQFLPYSKIVSYLEGV